MPICEQFSNSLSLKLDHQISNILFSKNELFRFFGDHMKYTIQMIILSTLIDIWMTFKSFKCQSNDIYSNLDLCHLFSKRRWRFGTNTYWRTCQTCNMLYEVDFLLQWVKLILIHDLNQIHVNNSVPKVLMILLFVTVWYFNLCDSVSFCLKTYLCPPGLMNQKKDEKYYREMYRNRVFLTLLLEVIGANWFITLPGI